jgi:hypothetical protein
MNTNDPVATYGKPMMTDDQLDDLRWQHDVSDGWVHTGVEDEAMLKVRDFYENLIHEGRLKVVEECRVKIDTSPGEWNGMHLLGCNGRGPVTDEVFCPYCGNKIKQ